MKHLIIIGGGGFAREVYNFALESKGYGTEYDIKGFLDIDSHSLDSFEGYPPIIGEESSYDIKNDDVFITAIGDNHIRQKVVKIITSKGGEFITLIHNTARINTNVQIGNGCIIQPQAYVGADSVVGNHTYLQNNDIIGHDVRIGSFCRIDCNVVFVGGTCASDFVTVHTNSVINHRVSIGSEAVVGACSFVIRKVKESTTVCGNPAKTLKF